MEFGRQTAGARRFIIIMTLESSCPGKEPTTKEPTTNVVVGSLVQAVGHVHSVGTCTLSIHTVGLTTYLVINYYMIMYHSP